MSQRRMFSPDIVDSDAFLDMPQTSQLLYFHLAMRADDDGFVSPKKIMRLVGAGEDDLKVLLTKRFVLSFQSGVIVIKHWLIHNLIRKDRYKETRYLEEKATLAIKENGSYTELATNGLPNGNQMAPQVRLGKVRLGKENNAPPTSDIIKNLIKEEDKGGIKYDFQYVGLDLYERLGVPLNKKSECIRLAKTYPALIMPALSFAMDYQKPELKWKMFLWKLNTLNGLKK